MPWYSYKSIADDEIYDIEMTIAEMEQFELDNKETVRRILKPVAFGDPVRLGVHKQPGSWNDLVKTIRKRNHDSNLSHGNGEV